MTKLKSIFLWLISFFYTPVTQTQEVETMSEPLVDTAVDVQPSAVILPVVAATPAAEVKAGVADLDAALSFIETGIAQLGKAAKDELKELAKKYL